MARVTTRSGQRIEVRLRRAEEAARAAVKDAMVAGGEMLRAHVVRQMQAPKHGRAYKRRSVVHVASAPGEFPAVDTGRLLSSIGAEVSEESGRLALDFGLNDATHVVYGAWLELGTRKIAPRPWLRPTWQAVGDDVLEMIRTEVREAVRRAGKD